MGTRIPSVVIYRLEEVKCHECRSQKQPQIYCMRYQIKAHSLENGINTIPSSYDRSGMKYEKVLLCHSMGKSHYAVSTVSRSESKISSACVTDVHSFDELTLTAFSMVLKDLSEPSTICSGIHSSKKQIPNCSETVHYLH